MAFHHSFHTYQKNLISKRVQQLWVETNLQDTISQTHLTPSHPHSSTSSSQPDRVLAVSFDFTSIAYHEVDAVDRDSKLEAAHTNRSNPMV
ncbi:hypothetical protein PGTUg99_021839 [Puccinia graminis f. sp. tritici]|uniref:Uncharacterized protein n=1 Tax=Puccinia graminis f. sp. tritici TaxID=56615 RepID=A0A5B0NHA4_PUCGR|nr:hypothetical protein PGTUg99_021839 [Puccinia graminis f. sp. tritici]